MLGAGGLNDPPYQQHLYESRTQSMKQKPAESLEDIPTILIRNSSAKSQRIFFGFYPHMPITKSISTSFPGIGSALLHPMVIENPGS